ncbi:AAA family ATPase [Desulfobacterales bacterium HSG2]|nr:AAA family ATPase [Desulfobacterales bacterium HSG2]
MHIRIRNFGPIKDFSFDLTKDFVVIFGKNNIGKSYAISVVYLILKSVLRIEKDRLAYVSMISDQINALSERIREELSQEKEMDIKKEIEEIVKDVGQSGFISDFRESLCATFEESDSVISRFAKQRTDIRLCTNDVEITAEISKKGVNISEVVIRTDSMIATRGKTENHATENNRLFLRTRGDERIALTKFVENILSTLYNQAILRIYYLPASRSGLYQALNAFSPIFAELSRNRGFLKGTVGIPSIPEPVSDYFLELSGIRIRENGNQDILEIVGEMEKEILKGEVLFDPETKKILYKPFGTDMVLDTALASSMVSELSPVVASLKYIIAFTEAKPLLFIEEPEAHLHPETQIRLTEMFSKLVRAGVRIVMTSHSDYMFNKMNNLILERKVDIASTRVVIFNETDEGSIAKDIPVEELGIDDENFLDSVEMLLNEKAELIEKLNRNG